MGVRPKRIFECRGGWGFKNVEAFVLYGWPLVENYFDNSS